MILDDLTFIKDYGVVLRSDFEEFKKLWNGIFILEPILSNDFFKELAENHKLLILSDTNETHFEFIREHFPVLKNFHDFILSYEVGHLKPAEEIFQVALEKAKCKPKECLFTDDKKSNCEGAEKLGIRTIHFESREQFINQLMVMRS